MSQNSKLNIMKLTNASLAIKLKMRNIASTPMKYYYIVKYIVKYSYI